MEPFIEITMGRNVNRIPWFRSDTFGTLRNVSPGDTFEEDCESTGAITNARNAIAGSTGTSAHQKSDGYAVKEP